MFYTAVSGKTKLKLNFILITFLGISVELLQQTAWNCLHQDSGHREIKTITKVLSLLDQVNPTFHETYVNEAVNADLDTVFLLHLLCSLSDKIFQGKRLNMKQECLFSPFWGEENQVEKIRGGGNNIKLESTIYVHTPLQLF